MKNKRRTLVDGRYQAVQALAVVLGNTLAVLIAAALMSWFYLIVMDGSLAVNHNRAVPLYLLCGLALVILASAGLSLYRSRSVAGMMQYLYHVLDDASKGIFPDRPIAFRKSDDRGFRRLASPLNACLGKMQAAREAPSMDALAVKAEGMMAELEKPVPDYRAVKTAAAEIAAGINRHR